jgi:two-component system sensor histidine kinase KdpD
MRLRTDLARGVVVLALLAVVTFLYRRFLPVNPTTAALTFLVMVLITAAFWRFRIALVASLVATAMFNFFFLPPYGTFTIADPQNWVALFAFLITAVIASNLAERVRRQAELAELRRSEVERLYALSQRLLTSENTAGLFNQLPSQVAETFAAEGAALLISGRDTVYQSSPELQFDRDLLLSANARGEISEADGFSYLPLRIGVKPAGALAIKGVTLSRETMEAVGSLVGIASERARAIEELAHTRAEQESEKLRSALLDSMTHEFRTPLTSIKASVTGLLDEGDISEPERRDLLTVIDEESDRLNRLVGEAAEMAQLDAHMFTLDRQQHSIGDVIHAAIENVHGALQKHAVGVDIANELPLATFDFDRIREVLMHLIENAAKYSAPGKPISISAEMRGSHIAINVADQGSGIDSIEQPLIFEKFYRGMTHRQKAQGTGMGLAISKVIAEAHGGSISVVSQIGAGSVFTLHLPTR